MFKIDFRNIKNLYDYNIYLVSLSIKYTYKEYVLTIHSHLNKNIDISNLVLFLDYSLKKNEFIINKDNLIEYKLISDKNNETMLDLINRFELIQNEDYRIRKLKNEQIIEYKFTPNMLKKCLMKYSLIYRQYYLILEEYLSFFILYQEMYNKKLEIMYDIKLDKLINTNLELNNNILTLNSRLDVIERNMNVSKNLNDIYYRLEDLTNIILNQNIEKIAKNICVIYKIDMNKYLIIDCAKNLFEDIYNMKALKYSYIDKKLVYEYKSKKFNIFYKLINKFKKNIEVNNVEITLLDPITLEDIDKFIKEILKI